MTCGSQPGAIVVMPEALGQPAPSVAQATESGMGRMEGDAAKGSLNIMVLGERSASIPLTPSITRGGVPAGASRREGSVALGVGGESSLALTSMGGDLPAWGEPLLRWTNPQDPVSTLFTLDDIVESMERESLDVGVTSMLEALDHAQGALADVVVPTGWVFA